jgi:hypothetical protein
VIVGHLPVRPWLQSLCDHTIIQLLVSAYFCSTVLTPCGLFFFQAVGATSAFSKRFLSGDAIIGVVIGCVGVLAALLAAVVVVVRRRGTVRTRGDSSDCGSDDSEAQVCVNRDAGVIWNSVCGFHRSDAHYDAHSTFPALWCCCCCLSGCSRCRHHYSYNKSTPLLLLLLLLLLLTSHVSLPLLCV